MGNSIFEFDDKFGVESPFQSDWVKEDFGSTNSINNIPTISLKDKSLKSIPILKIFKLDFVVDDFVGEDWQKIIAKVKMHNIEIWNSNKNVILSKSSWTARRGWTISTFIGTKEPCTTTLQFIVDGEISNTINLTFIDERPLGTKILTVEDVKNIVKVLREKTYFTDKGRKYPLTQLPWYSIDKIFHRNNETGKFSNEIVTNPTFENFTAQLNHIFKKYTINNANRRCHFLAQSFVETERFTKTVENGQNKLKYDDFRGRGLLHLTWESNYIKYSDDSGIDVKGKNYFLVSTNLEIGADAAGWYWTKGSIKGNINKIADSKTVTEVTEAVNGGDNALDEREKSFNLLKTLFDEK